jgi:hypothetical protein
MRSPTRSNCSNANAFVPGRARPFTTCISKLARASSGPWQRGTCRHHRCPLGRPRQSTSGQGPAQHHRDSWPPTLRLDQAEPRPSPACRSQGSAPASATRALNRRTCLVILAESGTCR